MDKIVEVFEDLIRRHIAPSASFFVLLAAGNLIAAALVQNSVSPGDLVATWINWFGFIYKQVNSVSLLGAVFLLGLVGLSYILSTLSQVLYDNTLKENFCSCFCFKNKYLNIYRKRVCKKLDWYYRNNFIDFDGHLAKVNRQDLSDYVLYEILGGIDPTDTRRFVNDAKAYGIIFISSVIVVIQIYFQYYHKPMGPLDPQHICFPIIGVILFYLGRETVKAQYRARALRLYVNFLAMPHQRITKILLAQGKGDEQKGA